MIRTMLLRSVVVACVTFAASAHAGLFTQLVVFGDSLSDNGSDYALSSAIHAVAPSFPVVPGAPDSLTGRFSNGPVAVEHLAAALGLPLTPHYLTPPFLGAASGGTNYAQGGATSGVENASLPATIGGGLQTGFKGVTSQIADYTSSVSAADAGALYVVWAGPNDFIHPGATAILPGCALAPSPVICTTVTNIANGVSALASLGAEHILVPNLPDFGQVPRNVALGPVAAASAHAFSIAINAALAAALANVDVLFPDVVVPFDTFGVLNRIVSNPGAFGFANVTDACLTGSTADATSVISAACAAIGPDRYVFWDDIHPTAHTHAIVGREMVAAVLPEPSAWLLVGIALALLVLVGRRARQPALAADATRSWSRGSES